MKKLMIQLSLFPEIIEKAQLYALNSPKHAFYKIWIEEFLGKYRVGKESGIGGKVLDKRKWIFKSLEEAKKFYFRKLKQKTDPNRKSPRKYFEN